MPHLKVENQINFLSIMNLGIFYFILQINNGTVVLTNGEL